MAHEAHHTDANDPQRDQPGARGASHCDAAAVHYVFATLLVFTGITVGAAYVDWACSTR
jgi:hypothetical protein